MCSRAHAGRLVFLFALGSFASAGGGEVYPAVSATLPDTGQRIESLRQKHHLPALAVVVVKDGKICERAATGVRKVGNPALVTTNDLFHIGSCTKSMTATLTAIMIEAGTLRWDTTIAEAFPELKLSVDLKKS